MIALFNLALDALCTVGLIAILWALFALLFARKRTIYRKDGF